MRQRVACATFHKIGAGPPFAANRRPVASQSRQSGLAGCWGNTAGSHSQGASMKDIGRAPGGREYLRGGAGRNLRKHLASLLPAPCVSALRLPLSDRATTMANGLSHIRLVARGLV